MIKKLLQLHALVLIVFAAGSALAQTPAITAREKQWQSHQPPAEEFVRASDADKTMMFRVPATWQREATTELSFIGPHSSQMKVFVEKVPDGVPLTDFIAALAQQLRNQPGVDEMLVRRTQMSGLEAREILLQNPDATGEMRHRVIWSTVDGPRAVSFVLMVPSAKVPDIEPIFKAVIQSVNILGEQQFGEFESLRTAAIKESKPARIDELQRLTQDLNGFDLAARRAGVEKLASLFRTSPDAAIDLFLNRRALVRASAVEAIGNSRNAALAGFLLRALGDREAFVAERAGRAIATLPDVVGHLRSHSLEWQQPEPVARVWPFLATDRRKEILREIFSPRPRSNSNKPKPRRATSTPPPGLRVLGNVVVQNQTASSGLANDPSLQLTGLLLLRQLPVSDFQLPLAQLAATNEDTLIRAALEVGLARNERLAVEPLLKLLTSTNKDIARLAVENLGNSGSILDVARIEAWMKQPTRPQSAPQDSESANASAQLALAIQKIRLREEIAAAKNLDDRQAIVKRALSDPKLADWVWVRFAHKADAVDTQNTSIKSPPTIRPFAENVLPANVSLYAALPNPSATLDRLSQAFNAIQMDTARQQADLVLMMNALRLQLAAQVNAESGSPISNYLGIDGTAPAVVARWNADDAPRGIPSAVRRALFVRVSDRERFERLLGLYQRSAGDTTHLVDYLSGGVRFLGILPGVFPMAARMILEEKSEQPKELTILRFGFVGATQWNGYPIKMIAQHRIDSAGHIIHDTAYIAYLGETALVTPDLDSLRDVLTRASSSQPTLATNQEFKNILGAAGDAVYISHLSDLLASPGDKAEFTATESGSLKITNSVWENLFQLHLPESDWSKPLIRFKPAELAAPRDLLPAASFAYFMSMVDAPGAWTVWSTTFKEELQTFRSIWAADFERDVIGELGPEFGIAAVGVPDISGDNWNVPLVVFFQLRTDKLRTLFDKGLLLNGKPAKPNVVSIKLGTADGFAAIRNGFLVIANSQAALDTLESKDKLSASPHFNKTLQRAPNNLVAFAGLNQDAGVDAVTKSSSDPEKQSQLSALLSIAKAFHSQTFYATADANGVGARFSTLIGREGRYSVAELSSLAKDQVLTFAIIEPRGVPISNQEQLKHMRLRMRTKAGGEADRVVTDISSPSQLVTKKSDHELEVTIEPRRLSTAKKVQLPINDPKVAQYLQPTRGIRANDPSVIAKAREIAGTDRDAWRVAQKLADWTFKNLTWKHVQVANAAQTLATREADCSEFSQLYVAMARSLGLPARIVSGLAYSGSSFGGHAWVEVFIGDWIELDPTFGTDFVDATHVRDATGGLLTYAALNLIDIEVLDAPRGAAEFQRDPKSLVTKLSAELPTDKTTALTASLDLALLTDRQMGQGSWAAMSEAEREKMTSAYRRIVFEMIASFQGSDDSGNAVRVLRVKETGELAEALLMRGNAYAESLLKLTLQKNGDGWYLVEAMEADTGLKIVSDMLKPAIWQITDQRAGKTGRSKSSTSLARVLIAINENPKTAITVADQVLKEEPHDQTLLYAKSLVLANDEKTVSGAIEIWSQLSSGQPPLAAAVLKLATHLAQSENEEERRRALALLEKYVTLEPDDPRGHRSLAVLYEGAQKFVQAEAEYRAAIVTDSSSTEVYLDLAEFLATQKKYSEAVTAINDAAKYAAEDEDVFGSTFLRLLINDGTVHAEAIAQLVPRIMESSSSANLYLGRMRMNSNRTVEALRVLRKATELDKKSAAPWIAIAECYRSLKNWPAALSAANTAIDRDAEDSEAYYQRACAQARLGRPREAMASLKRSVELDPDQLDFIEEEADLKSLSSLTEFKKLLSNRDKQ